MEGKKSMLERWKTAIVDVQGNIVGQIVLVEHSPAGIKKSIEWLQKQLMKGYKIEDAK